MLAVEKKLATSKELKRCAMWLEHNGIQRRNGQGK
jgi:hypothetical protein